MTGEPEEWRAIVGQEGFYEVSSLGRVRSLDRLRTFTRADWRNGEPVTITSRFRGRLLTPVPDTFGYLVVALGNQVRNLRVHHAVLTAFVGPCPAGMIGLHGDDDPANNRLSNLRWGTHADNWQDAIKNGKRRAAA